MNNKYLINFVIPQGPTGPQGITGPTGSTGPSFGLNAYGGKYNSTQQTINLSINTPTQVTLPSQMPNLNVSYNPSNSITITEAGIYEINYFVNIFLTIGTTITCAVRANGTNIPSSIISKVIKESSNNTYTGSIIVSIASQTVLDLTISSLIAVGISFTNGVNASLTIKKLN